MPTFAVDIETRGTEPDRTLTIPIPTLFRYLEHSRWQCIVDPSFGLREYVHAGHFFVVRSQRLELLRRFGQQVPIRLYVWITKVGRSVVELQHELRRTDLDVVVARAHVQGLFMNASRRLARIPDEVRETVGGWADPPPAPRGDDSHITGESGSFLHPPYKRYDNLVGLDFYVPGEFPDAADFEHKLRVRPSDIDIFDHVNAATYLQWVDDARIAAAKSGAFGAASPRYATPSVRAAVTYLQETLVDEEVTVRLAMLDPEHNALLFGIYGPDATLRVLGRVDADGEPHA